MSDSATLWTVAHQAPLCMGFSRQEYWSGLPCPPPGIHASPLHQKPLESNKCASSHGSTKPRARHILGKNKPHWMILNQLDEIILARGCYKPQSIVFNYYFKERWYNSLSIFFKLTESEVQSSSLRSGALKVSVQLHIILPILAHCLPSSPLLSGVHPLRKWRAVT